jgi:hypothetical protein
MSLHTRLAGTAAAFAACLAFAGCGSGHPAADPAARLIQARRTPAAATAAANRSTADSEARRLLSLARIPDGAVRLRAGPRSLSGPAMGTPAVSSLVDTARFWRVAMSFQRALAWLQAHPPRQLAENGTASTWDGHGTSMAGFSYGGPASPAWQSAALEIGVAPAAGGGTVIRADAVVVWLDPRPVPDNVTGPRARVTVAGGCPGSDAGYVGVSNPGSRLTGRLLPAAIPAAGLECRYDGMNGRAWKLREDRLLGPAAAGRLASTMARLPLGHVDGGITSCPMDDGSAEIIALSYAHQADVDLWVNLNGCGGVSNGYIVVGGQ